MAKKKEFKEWKINIDGIVFERASYGELSAKNPDGGEIYVLSARGARRLYQKLSGDYAD